MKTCTKCGQEKPFTDFSKHSGHKDRYSSHCKSCKSISDKGYQDTHEELVSKRKQTWYNNHREYCSKKNAGYYKEHKNHLLALNKEWRESHPEQWKEYKKQWNAVYNHKEEIIQYKSQWAKNKRTLNKKETLKQEKVYRDANKERILKINQIYRRTPKGKLSGKNCCHRRRSLIGDAPNITIAQWNKILMLQDVRCNSCKRKFGSNLKPTMDHIIPLSKGGSHTFENIQALCKKCNSTKQAKIDKSLIVTWIAPQEVVS